MGTAVDGIDTNVKEPTRGPEPRGQANHACGHLEALLIAEPMSWRLAQPILPTDRSRAGILK